MGELPDKFNSHHGSQSCSECSRQCTECKEKMSKMESKLLKMTIALTSALTLIGQQGVEYIVSVIENTEKIVAPEESKDKKEKTDSMSYRFGGNSKGYPSNFSSHFDFNDYSSNGDGGDEEIFLADTKKNKRSRDPQYSLQSKWIFSSPKELSEQSSMLSLNENNVDDMDYSLSSFNHKKEILAADLTLNDRHDHIQYEYSINYASGIAVPSPSAILVLALGGMANSRSRY